MAIELVCAECGAYFQPTRAEITAGDYRLCPECRERVQEGDDAA